MANGTLQYLLRESKSRPADREAFAQAMSRLSEFRSKRAEREQKPTKSDQKGG
jgi:hypothetical protein